MPKGENPSYGEAQTLNLHTTTRAETSQKPLQGPIGTSSEASESRQGPIRPSLGIHRDVHQDAPRSRSPEREQRPVLLAYAA